MARLWTLLVLAAAAGAMPQLVDERGHHPLDLQPPQDSFDVPHDFVEGDVLVDDGLRPPLAHHHAALHDPLLVLVDTDVRVRDGSEEEEELDRALDELMEVVSEEELVAMLEEEVDEEASLAVLDAMLRRVRRSPENCEGLQRARPMCQHLLRLAAQQPGFDGELEVSSHESGDRDGASFVTGHRFRNQGTFGDGSLSGNVDIQGTGGETIERGNNGTGDFVRHDSSSQQSSEFNAVAPGSRRKEFATESSSTSREEFTGPFSSSSREVFESSSSSTSEFVGHSGSPDLFIPSGGFGRRIRIDDQSGLEPSYSHEDCRPPVTHVIREAVEYLPKTVYNTQHMLLPSTRLLTMFETERYPQPHYVTETSTIQLPDITVTETLIQTERRTIDVNRPRESDFLVRSTKLHIFTDTRDYFWTKTEYTPYFVTETTYITSSEPHPISNVETRVIGQQEETTTTIPHVTTQTSTTTTVTRVFTTTTLHQYRYVTATPSAVTVTATVTSCF